MKVSFRAVKVAAYDVANDFINFERSRPAAVSRNRPSLLAIILERANLLIVIDRLRLMTAREQRGLINERADRDTGACLALDDDQFRRLCRSLTTVNP